MTLYLCAARSFGSDLGQPITTAQRVLGNTHGTTVSAIYGLGIVYLNQEQYDRSKEFLFKALEIKRRIVGEEHPEIFRNVNSLAVLCTKQKQYEDHPETLQTINDFGVLRREQKRYKEAESLLRPALEGRQDKLGKEHPACFESIHELAVLYNDQGDYDKAEQLLIEAI